jgi:hypothetical protein
MKTAEDRLAFAIDFAQKDLTQLRQGDWLNLKEDFEAFFLTAGQSATPQDLGGIITMPVTAPLPQDFTAEDFRRIQELTLNILASAADYVAGSAVVTRSHQHTQTGAIIPPTAMKEEEFKGNILFYVLPYPLSSKGQAFLSFTGSTRDLFFLILAFLLRQQPKDRIRRCPECQRLFLRMRKQAYCSRTCVNKVNKRTWREAREKRVQAPKRPRRKKAKAA